MAADQEAASKVGAEILARGGNAVDAAVATALALGVVNPTSSGLGGGGFAVVYVAAEKKLYVLDFREIAPAALTPERFLVGGKVNEELATTGGLAVGVPGEPAGLEELWRKHGHLPWKEIVEPARRLAVHGFRVSWFTAGAAQQVTSLLAPDWRMHDWLAPKGVLIAEGRRVRRSALARTLAGLERDGSRAFYRGWVADDLVATVTQAGGVLTLADLDGYRPTWRDPLVIPYGAYRIATMPLPSSGGIAVAEAFGLLGATGIDLGKLGAGSSAALHVIAELLEHAFADRARFLGDATAASAMVTRLLEPARLARIARKISPKRVGRHADYGEAAASHGAAPKADHGTSHLCVVDRDGNAVALTTTVNNFFGAKLVGGASGVVLNDQIDDFSLGAGVKNSFGLVQSDANLVGPGKKPLSSMTPTLVLEDDHVVACVGGSGGPRIISNVFQVLLDVLVFGMDAREALEAPRLHHQWEPDELVIEPVADDVVAALRVRGHKVTVSKAPTAVQLVVVRPDGRRQAASDPRKGGQPAAEDGEGVAHAASATAR